MDALAPKKATLLLLDDWERRKRFVGFDPADEEVLAELHLVARAYADEVMDELYRRWLAFDELRAFFQDAGQLARVKGLQKRYFLRLTSGEYGAAYLEDRLRIGRVHRRVGLLPRWYIGAYSIYLQVITPRVLAAYEYDRPKAGRVFGALTKIISLDQELALLAYFEEPSSPPRL